MSDVITGPGRYLHRRNREAEVFAERDRVWFGRFLSNGGDWMPGRWKANGAGHCGTPCIVGPWEEPIPPEPTVDVGDGWRLLEEGEMVGEGDECRLRDCESDPWTRSVQPGLPQSQSCVYRRRVQKPSAQNSSKEFRISDHGPGVYLTRDGKEAIVTRHEPEMMYPWQGYIDDVYRSDKSWKDCGTWQSEEMSHDLVRYLRPLPKPEWMPTDHYQQVHIVNGFEWTSRWQGTPPTTRRIEQKWTRGTESEWRPVVTDGK